MKEEKYEINFTDGAFTEENSSRRRLPEPKSSWNRSTVRTISESL